MGYTPSDLLSLNVCKVHLDHATKESIFELGLSKPHTSYKTRRGCRGGVRLNRKLQVSDSQSTSDISNIQTLVTTNRVGKATIRTCNPENLVCVPVNKWNVPSILNANVRSVNNKFDELGILCRDKCIDIACLTETWCNEKSFDTSLTGYSCVRHDRDTGQRGGGIMCFIKDSIPFKHWQNLQQEGIESLWLTIRPFRLPRKFTQIILGLFYHPPGANNSHLASHISTVLDTLLNQYPDAGVVLTGDFNHFKDSLITHHYNYKQIVKKPTREERILDKIYTNMSELYPNADVLPPISTSDHQAVLLQPRPMLRMLEKQARIVERRRMGHNERTMFVNALSKVNWLSLYNLQSCEEQFAFFEKTINALMDEHIPMQIKVIEEKDKPWVTDQYKQLLARRQASFLRNDLPTYRKLRNQANRKSKSLKQHHYRNNVEQLKTSNPRQWWNSIKHFTNKTKPNPTSALQSLAQTYSDGDFTSLANKINAFFVSISSDLPPLSNPPIEFQVPANYIISVADVERKLASINTNKSLGPDNIPNWILKDCAPLIAAPPYLYFQ